MMSLSRKRKAPRVSVIGQSFRDMAYTSVVILTFRLIYFAPTVT